MRVVHTAGELHALHGCVFVPTMGALHAGHASLVRTAAAHAAAAGASAPPVVVSVFVNPTQFAPHEDFSRYPRTLEADVALAADAGATAVFAPAAEEIYPDGAAAAAREAAQWPLPPAAREPGLEDAVRPGHFGGVCQVVARLFDLVRPANAVFGEKDWQQMRVVEQMVEAGAARWPGLRIVRGPTVREPGGLAMSSRNRYLSPEERSRALGLKRALEAAARADGPDSAEAAMRDVLEAHGCSIDYAVVRDPQSLRPLARPAGPARALVAARLPSARLIDNAPLPGWDSAASM